MLMVENPGSKGTGPLQVPAGKPVGYTRKWDGKIKRTGKKNQGQGLGYGGLHCCVAQKKKKKKKGGRYQSGV